MGIFKTSVVFLTLIAISSFQGLAFYDRDALSIDCGATIKSVDNATYRRWETDEEFIKTGEVQFLPLAMSNISLYQMKTLRSFPKGDRNCYNLTFQPQQKFLVRAGFCYGNYDGLLKPPTFVLELDHSLNATVATSLSDDPVYVEFVFMADKQIGDVCLVRTQPDNVPFISTLESTNLYEYSQPYRLMPNHTALYLETRLNYGANKTVPQQFSRIADPYNRLWKPEEVSGYRNLAPSFDAVTLSSYARTENYPPFAMLHYAVEAYNTSQSIFLPVKFHGKSQHDNVSAYFVFYFADFKWNSHILGRTVAIYIDGDEKNVTEILPWYNDTYPVVSVYPVSVKGGAANVTIAAAEGSKLPPILSGMEVYSVMSQVISSQAVHVSNFPLASLFCFLLLSTLAWP